MKLEMTTGRLELYKYEEAYVNEPHRHSDWFQVTIPVRGACEFTQSGKNYRLAEGEVLLQRPAEEHHFRTGPGESVLIVKLHESLFPVPQGCGNRLDVNPSEAAEKFGFWTSGLINSRNEQSLRAAESLVVLDVKRMLEAGMPAAGGQETESETELIASIVDPHLRDAWDYIRAHYKSAVPVETLSAIALQSRYHFIRSFKAATGLTPHQTVLKLRMREARRLLAGTSETVTAISAGLGFSSASQFYRAFLKDTGKTPERYRHDSRG
ncbi:AraC family transcriptional regulator [Paenibacillus sp. UNC499MF]|uniref:AraC family transcriptional regulator n=1 Tax=Paenibacillus sp. UNC499MF TaxID=1502751 RepID=UPI0008A0060F|nr:AraC family transcriptional regulator [Paenibacillus sp. UNC499MF]SEG47221.1 AraC family transcriptional regulator [Paenibacillus sp. UNC499MF]